MKKIHDSQLLAAYVKQHDLQNYMDADILTMASLQSFQKGRTFDSYWNHF